MDYIFSRKNILCTSDIILLGVHLLGLFGNRALLRILQSVFTILHQGCKNDHTKMELTVEGLRIHAHSKWNRITLACSNLSIHGPMGMEPGLIISRRILFKDALESYLYSIKEKNYSLHLRCSVCLLVTNLLDISTVALYSIMWGANRCFNFHVTCL